MAAGGARTQTPRAAPARTQRRSVPRRRSLSRERHARARSRLCGKSLRSHQCVSTINERCYCYFLTRRTVHGLNTKVSTLVNPVCPVFRDAHPAGAEAAGRDFSAEAGPSPDAEACHDARACPVPEATLAGGLRPLFRMARAPVCVAGALKTLFVCTARRPRGSYASSCSSCAGRASDWFSCGRMRPTTICQAPGWIAARCQGGQAMPRHVLLELLLDQAGE